MKKILSLFLMLVFGFFSFAETGYRGIEWYSNENEVDNQIDSYIYNIDNNLLSTVEYFTNMKIKIKN